MKIPKAHKMTSGNWYIQLRLGGKSISVTAPTKKECERQATLLKAEYKAANHGNGKREDRRLREVVEDYINSKVNVLSPSTIRGYRVMTNRLFRDIMGEYIADIENWQKAVNQEAGIRQPTTVRNGWGLITASLKFAGIEVPAVTLPQVPQKERPWLDYDQIQTFLAAIKGSPAEMAALLALHSLRRSELLALDVNSIRNGKIYVSGAVVYGDMGGKSTFCEKETNKNKSSSRVVPIFLPRLTEVLPPAGKLVVQSPDVSTRQINRICAAHGLPEVGLHGLRHSFCSLCVHLDIPIDVCMQLGGWSDFQTMKKIYTHISNKDIDSGAEKLKDFFKNAK